MLHYISGCLDKKSFKCFLDLERHQTETGGTIPPNLVVTRKKPDIVIVDNKCKEAYIFELTISAESRLEIAHKLKSESYEHLVTDIRTHSVTVTPFEVGAKTGYLSFPEKNGRDPNFAFIKY